jgi:hypothetical protein
MSQKTRNILIALAGIFLLGILVYQIPAVKSRLDWRIEVFQIYVKNVIDPVGPVPTALPVTPQVSTSTPAPTNTVLHSYHRLTPTATFPPLPAQVLMNSPVVRKANAQ